MLETNEEFLVIEPRIDGVAELSKGEGEKDDERSLNSRESRSSSIVDLKTFWNACE